MRTDVSMIEPRHRPVRRNAFSYAEAMICVVILGTAISAGMSARSTYFRGVIIDKELAVAQELANELMAEILSAAFEDPQSSPGSVGIESGETARENYDDVDDYNGLSESPPKKRDGTSMTEYTGYTRIAVVNNVDDDTLSTNALSGSTASKRVLIIVTRNSKLRATLYGYRTRNDQTIP